MPTARYANAFTQNSIQLEPVTLVEMITLEEALEIIDRILESKRLNHTQQLVFSQSWMGQTYSEIAENLGYDFDYIKEVGSLLWQSLSEALGEKVTKKNVQSVLANYQRVSTKTPASPLITNHKLEFPSGPVPLNSNFYIERPPIEASSYTEIEQPGSLIRIKAPRQMGKTSLMQRVLAHAKQLGFRTVLLSLHKADNSVFTSLDKFLRWFCANVSRQLNLTPKLDEYWDEDIGSKVSCTLYIQSYLLAEIDTPVVLALDEVNRLFEYGEVSEDFLPLLRSWYEDAAEIEEWQKLRFIVVHATESYVPLNINQSPFNVGLPIKLPEFTVAQVEDLVIRHGLSWIGPNELEQLMAMVGGHPRLVRLALYHLANPPQGKLGGMEGLIQLLEDAPTIAGIYSNHLRFHLSQLQKSPELVTAFQQVVNTPVSVRIEAIAAYKLESMGLVKLQGNEATISCELYRQYFSEQLSDKN
ncbi:AAA-like domain-containing protein [Floridanema fluviatile]